MQKEQLKALKIKVNSNPEIFNNMLLNNELTEFFGNRKVSLGLTLVEIGFIFDLSRERIRQIEKSSHIKLKHPDISYSLRKYMDL